MPKIFFNYITLFSERLKEIIKILLKVGEQGLIYSFFALKSSMATTRTLKKLDFFC